MLTESPSLLITDDDWAFRETVRSVLEPLGVRTLLAGDGTMTFTKRKVRANVAQHLRSQGHTVRMGVTHGKNGKTLFLLSAPVVANAKAKAAAQEKEEQEKKAQ